MRKLASYMFTSIDGYIADSEGGLGWAPIDDELMRFANDHFRSFDGIVFSRRVYQEFVDYWDALPAAEATALNVEFAGIFRVMKRIVVSRTLDDPGDERTVVIRGEVPESIERLKREPGNDLMLIAGPELRSTLSRHGLVDRHEVLVAPVVLGAGRALFDPIDEPLGLRLADTRRFGGGVVLLGYAPA